MIIDFKPWADGNFVGMEFSIEEQKQVGFSIKDMSVTRAEAIAKVSAVVVNSAIKTAMIESKKQC